MESTFAEGLLAARKRGSPVLPVREKVEALADGLLGLLFPHFSATEFFSADEIEGGLKLLQRQLKEALVPLTRSLARPPDDIAAAFFRALPGVYGRLEEDARAIESGDPAAESVDEVIAAYPGFLAITLYRFAHELYRLEVPILPRIMTECAHQRTGIDIHPGARIGRSFCIDHGTGIVIGETTAIGDRVKMYQGVTLGALSVDKAQSASKRHPTIEDRVVIYSNATILGGGTIIGHDSVIGGNVWLTESVPPFSVVYHRSEMHVRDSRTGIDAVDFVI
jgi:serine O-acetyltransferase